MAPLVDLEKRYGELDGSAVRFKGYFERSRKALLGIGVLIVFLQSLQYVASELDMAGWLVPATPLKVSVVLSALSAVLTSVASFLTVASSRVNLSRRWIAARAGAEALRSESFLYRSRSGRYAAADRDALLAARLLEIEDMVDDIIDSDERAGAA